MSNRNHSKKSRNYQDVFNTCNDLQKKVIFYLSERVDEVEGKVNIEELVKEHRQDKFLSIDEVLVTMNRDQLAAADYILKACERVHNKAIEEENNGVHEA